MPQTRDDGQDSEGPENQGSVGDPKTGSNKNRPLLYPVAQEVERLYREQAPRIYAYLRGPLGADQRTAEDVMHTAFINLGTRMIKPPPLNDPVPYLFRSARNIWIDSVRALAHSVCPVPELEHDHADPASDDFFAKAIHRVDHREQERAVREALAKLSPRQLEIVFLHSVCGLSTPRIAVMLKMQQTTVRGHLKAGRDRLKHLLHLDDEREEEAR